jgi:heat shock protein HtpX
MLTRFAISRKREFMADAGGAELTRNPLALASALRKISSAPGLGHIDREDIAQLYIIHPKKIKQNFFDKLQSLFSTHPSTEERIRILEQF